MMTVGIGGDVRGDAGLRVATRSEIGEHQQWLEQRGLSPRTTEAYGRVLLRLSIWLEVRSSGLLTATPQELMDWREGLTVSSNSVLSYMTAVKSFYSWAQASGRVIVRPDVDVPLPKIRKGRPRPISEERLRVAILNAPKRIRPWLFLAALAGLRCAEIAGLRREDLLDTADEPVIIVMGKGRKERIVPLSPQLWQELTDYGLPKFGIVFLRYDGQRGQNNPKLLSQLVNNYLRSVGIAETLHQLRHRFGTRAFRVHKDLRVVQELMGHADPATTALYADYCRSEAISTVLGVQIDLGESDGGKLPVDPPGQEVSRTPDGIVGPRVDEGEPPVALSLSPVPVGRFKFAPYDGPAHDYPVRKPGTRPARVLNVEPKKTVLTLQVPHGRVQLNFSHGLLFTGPVMPRSSGQRSRRRRARAWPGRS
jgi:integrase/recombinase XerC